MKKLITLALVLVMAMVCLTACGVEYKSPEGTYASDSGTYKAEFTGYNADENVGNLSITFTIMDTPTVVTGTYSLAVNDPDAGTFFVDFTREGAEAAIEGFMIYDPNQNVVAQYVGLEDIGGENISYYASNEDAE